MTWTETARLAAVRRYDILDTPPDGSFERITAISARRFGVPISIISIVDEDRIWFKSHNGLDVQQIGRDPGLCASAILQDMPLLLEDATRDMRALSNPLVAGPMGLRFYLGAPLRTHDGHHLGTLCVIDRAPRTVSEQQIADLADLATLMIDQLELGLSARRALALSDVMKREIDHRVMNSLQFIASLLTMQGRASSAEAREALAQAAGRVSAVAIVHQQLHLTSSVEPVECLSFLRRLCAKLAEIGDVTITVTGHEATLDTQQMHAVGLLGNELVTNAGKHGGKVITVHCASAERAEPGLYSLVVCDNGPALPPHFDPLTHSTGMGMRLLKTLAAQLDGEVSGRPNPDGQGACFTVTFPASAKPIAV